MKLKLKNKIKKFKHLFLNPCKYRKRRQEKNKVAVLKEILIYIRILDDM